MRETLSWRLHLLHVYLFLLCVCLWSIAVEDGPFQSPLPLGDAIEHKIRMHVEARKRNAQMSAVLPPWLREELWSENRVSTELKYIVSRDYAELLCNLLSTSDADCSLVAAQAAFQYYCKILSRVKHVNDFADRLTNGLTKSLRDCGVAGAVWLLSFLSERPNVITELLLNCPHTAVRSQFIAIVSTACEVIPL